MARHVVAAVADVPPGQGRRIAVAGRDIALFNVDGAFFALSDRCPHEGASLAAGRLVGLAEADEPGQYRLTRKNEFLRCPWHGWEFDMRNGQSWFDPKRFKVRSYPVAVESGEELAEEMKKGPYVAETFPVKVEDSYVIVET